ncbi:porin [Alsobacter sp. KACC 23698]|uniref:Porin n=1 Tax=Alsobacter sp. KACC 23698 TaxID=3149229 RepID=A0AAU7J9Q5_9HYPH
MCFAILPAMVGAGRAEPRAAAPAPDAVLRPCPDFGAGFFQSPGNAFCLKISGRIRHDFGYDQTARRADDASWTETRGTLGLDAAALTDQGPVRAILRMTFRRAPTSWVEFRPPDLEYASMEWSGLTAGRAWSFFDRGFPNGGVTLLGGGANGRGSDRGAVALVGYSRPLWDDWSASVSLEDGSERRVGVAGAAPAGARRPDGVVTLGGSAWGHRLHAAGALHETRPDLPGARAVHGWAAQISWETPPFWPEGRTRLRAQAAFASAASDYVGWGYAGVAGVVPRTADAWATRAGAVSNRAWSAGVSLIHDGSPTLRLAAFAVWAGQDGPSRYASARIGTVGANVVWTPVRNSQAAAEILWQSIAVAQPLWDVVARGRTGSSAWTGRIRLQHDF